MAHFDAKREKLRFFCLFSCEVLVMLKQCLVQRFIHISINVLLLHYCIYPLVSALLELQ